MKTLKPLLRIFLWTFFIIWIGFLVIYTISRTRDFPNNMYVNAGTFDILYGNKLKIDNVNGHTKYSIFDSEENQIISNRYNSSDYQRWYIVSDTDGSVWVHSSDIGDVLYRRSSDNKFTEMEITSELCKISPDTFKNNLPSTLKKMWNCGIVEK